MKIFLHIKFLFQMFKKKQKKKNFFVSHEQLERAVSGCQNLGGLAQDKV